MVRMKNRYLIVDLMWNTSEGELVDVGGGGRAALPAGSTKVSAIDIFYALRDIFIMCYGDAGWGRAASSAAKYYNPQTSIAVIRTTREEHQRVWAALTMLRQIGGEEVVCRVIDVSGSVRTCRCAAAAVEKRRFALTRERMENAVGRKAVDESERNAMAQLHFGDL
mmetsp:Transcript_16351/g.32309  ORF Transcript_16351/g.32309 Transcript_16351/m.32309 type:complete len:166 (-) Transcript_16351:416-913(-)